MSRLATLTRAMREAKLDAVAVVPGANLRYLCGLDYHHGERLSVALITSAGRAAFVLPAMEAGRVGKTSTIAFELHPWTDSQPSQAVLEKAVADLSLSRKTIGVEHLAMRVFELRALEAATGGRFVDAGPVFSSLRAVKQADELAAMAEAGKMIDDSLRGLLPRIRPGLSEHEVAAMWVEEMSRAGSDAPAFDTIVASGPNSAFPHHTTGGRKLAAGDLVILDGGCRCGGYASDITRTVCLGKAGEAQRKVYELVQAANSAGRSASRPGATGAQIDAAARKVIIDAGHADHFPHRTGHGLGLEVHEEPYINSANTTPLLSGNVFTVEPGVYIEGLGGVRIEDDVALTESGHRTLTNFPRELVELIV